MIAQLTGTVRHLTTEKVILEVGGVGYSISITPRTSMQIALGAIATLNTSLVVREDSLTLFGFLDMRGTVLILRRNRSIRLSLICSPISPDS